MIKSAKKSANLSRGKIELVRIIGLETLNWRCLLLGVCDEASKRSHPWGKCVTWHGLQAGVSSHHYFCLKFVKLAD